MGRPRPVYTRRAAIRPTSHRACRAPGHTGAQHAGPGYTWTIRQPTITTSSSSGGGLAGGCLARQLHQEAPQLRTLVVEKRPHPVPEAAFKVGESSVEIGAHYFSKRLGLEAHLRTRQLEKLGLRYFFTHGDNRDITSRVELGPPQFPPVPSFQLDRGRLENMLLERTRSSASTCCTDAAFGADARRAERRTACIAITRRRTGRASSVVTARWVVDATGRTGLIKRKLGLARPSTHGANASWWRVKSRVEIDDWSTDPHWKARVPSGLRWQSTVHLMGPGYWVWLIPLGSGSHSFGIVADGDMHPYDRINRFERAMDWLREYEPQCAAVMEASRRRARGLPRAQALRAQLRACLLAGDGGHWSARPASSPIRSIHPGRISSRWATTTSPT